MSVGLFLLFATSSVQANSTMEIHLAGNKVGTSEFRRDADGKFSAKATLSIGTTTLSTSLTGKFDGNDLKDLDTVASTGGKETKFSIHGGKLKSGEKELDYSPKGKLLLGNLIPQFTKSLLTAVNFEDKRPQSKRAFMPDGGSEIPVTITPVDTRRVKAGTIRVYKVLIVNIDGTYFTNESGDVVGMDVPSQTLRFVNPAFADVFRDPFAPFPGLSQPSFGIKTMPGLKMKTRDGVALVQDVYLPDGPGKFPTVLMRTPYGRGAGAASAALYVKRGYAVVSQDCRGRDDSEGVFDPMVNEREDGYDAIDWISKQEWSDGNVGMIGGSYGGYVQWAAAVERHPALKCIIPQVSPPDAMHNLPYEYGVFTLYQNLWWGLIVADKVANMSNIKSSLPGIKRLTDLPLADLDKKVLGKSVPFWKTWLERTTDAKWKGWDHTKDITKVQIPVLHISGWWDGDQIGTKLHWEALRASGKKNQWLIYGPWSHAFNTTHRLGDVEYGDEAIIDLDPVYIQFFDTYLKKKSVNWDERAKVKVFITGANKWVNLKDWPDDSVSKPVSYFLSQNQPQKDGLDFGDLLTTRVNSKQPATTYTYDPSKEKIDPKFIAVDESKATTKVAFDRSKKEVVFRTSAMTKSTTITGPIDLDLYVSSSAPDTDFFSALLDWDEQGVVRVITNTGKLRASYRYGTDRQVALTPGKTEKVTIRIWDVAHEVKKGHRLGVMITSSIFPVGARNLGTMDPIATATKMVSQTNNIEHSNLHPSALRLRILN